FAAISQGERGGDSGFALLAMGGYGREEMNPCSDVDLLILHLPGKGKGLEEWLRAVLHPLWDWGLTVGYTVQTPKESWRVVQKDLDLWLSLLEGRFVAGEKGTFLLWEEEFSRSLSAENGKKIIRQIHERALARHGRTGDSVFVLEPEVKEGKGGLRDYHTALWASRIQYGVHSARELTEKKLLSEKEWKRYLQALGFLFRVRNQLHYLHGRREDRLSFEDQGAVAQAFGTPGEDFQQATEAFLKDYFTHALQVYRISWNLLEKCLDERAVSAAGEALENAAEVSSGLALYHGKLIGTDPFRFQRNPFFLWQAFQAIHQHGLEMDSQLKEAITENMDLVNERFRQASQSIHAFNSFFRQPGDLYRVLEAMHETGFLRKFLPEFDRVYCHVQYDRYHIYPVDVHSFYTIRELETLMRERDGASSPILGQLIREIKDPGILKLAALIHDLGKGEGSSHALRGEKIASSIGQRLKLPSLAQDILCFLVREHLAFVEIAQRRDLADENLIFRFAQTVGDSERLKMLYLLCYADLRAVGPSSWTVWKDTLMRELFLKTLHLLEKDEGLRKEAQDQRVNIQNEIMDLLRGQIPPPRISEYLVNIPSRHYAVHEARAIAQQILMAERLNLEKVVLEGEKKPEEGWDEIVVITSTFSPPRSAPGKMAPPLISSGCKT
ncbi:MAG: HD domain-containing protein, partial [Deltaproteobacteria bacterium]|nr:HD domain-containing protein [Deltaproteobacteria bacterium]